MTSEIKKYNSDEALPTRKLPPLNSMTRLQKRYFLEPWMTALTVASWAVSAAGLILAMFTQLHVEFACFGVLFLLIGTGFLITKANFMEWNTKTEGELQNRGR